MNKLLYANFARLKKDKLFWIEIIFMFGLGVIVVTNQYNIHIKYEYELYLDSIFFGYALLIGVLSAVFCSLFLGTEYSDGTIRNKLMIGHSRTAIYFSNLIVNICAASFMSISCLVAVNVLGVPLIGFMKTDLKIILLMLLGTFLMIVAFCSIFTLISMLCHNKTIAAVVSILGVIALLIVASFINAQLEAPEFYDNYVITDSVENMDIQKEPNPRYLTGTKRAIYEFIYDFLPTGQALQYYDMSAIHIWRMPMYSLIISVITTVIGVFFFRKKDIK